MKFGLVGNPLGHSLSKVIHLELFKLKNSQHTYDLFETSDLGNVFDNTLSCIDGFNVTIPFKTDVIKFLNFADDKVQLYGACNTVAKRNNKFWGYNTDANGFLNTLKRCGFDLPKKKILIIGSGGVSRMMVFEAVLNNAEVYITSRNIDKCNEIREEVVLKTAKNINVITGDNITPDFDAVFNGTPCGMFPNELDIPVAFEKIMNVPFVFDTIYNPRETLLTKLVKYCGNKAENGLYMLVSQAACAQEQFCGYKYSDAEITKVTDAIEVKPLLLNKNIIIIGLPGSGKSTVGKDIADLLNMKFVDTDAEIVKKHGDIKDIFKNYGEAHFRNIECDTIEKLSAGKNMVISTGGGIVENGEVMEKICNSPDNIVLFLNANFDVLLSRISKNDDRPLLAENQSEKLKNIIQRRMPLYNKLYDVKVDITKEQSIKKTVVQCVDKLCNK